MCRLTYSADIHGEGFSTFHSLICKRGPTVLVIEDENGHMFGGYASTSWRVGPQFFGKLTQTDYFHLLI